MDDVKRELAALRRRLRLMTVVAMAMLVVLAFAMGGAEVVARTVVMETDAWTLKTKDALGSLTPRLVCSSDVSTASLKVQNANVVLAQQSPLPTGVTAAIAFEAGSKNKFMVYNGTAWVEPGSQPFREFAFLLSPGTNFAWSNMPSAVTELANNTNLRKKLDLTTFTQFRLTSTQNVVGAASAKLRAQYSTDQTSWNNLEDTTTTADLDANSTGNAKVGAFGNIVAAAKADVFIRIVGVSGNGSADPAWRMIALHLK